MQKYKDISQWTQISAQGPSTTTSGAQHYRGQVTDDWAQGRTAFGGLVVAIALKAMQAQVNAERLLRSAQVSFIAPLASNTDTDLFVQVLREGGSLSFVEARLQQGTQVCCMVMGCFGRARETALQIEGASSPAASGPEDLFELPFMEGIAPNFTQHIAYRWTTETVPFSGAEQARCEGWCQLRNTDNIGAPELAVLIDAWPPPVFSIANGPIRGSSVTWHINFYHHPTQSSPQDWWFYQAESHVCDGGYADTTGHLWDQTGRLIADTRQLVAEFSKRMG